MSVHIFFSVPGTETNPNRGEIPMGDYPTVDDARAVLPECRDELLAQCGSDEERLGIRSGRFEIEGPDGVEIVPFEDGSLTLWAIGASPGPFSLWPSYPTVEEAVRAAKEWLMEAVIDGAFIEICRCDGEHVAVVRRDDAGDIIVSPPEEVG